MGPSEARHSPGLFDPQVTPFQPQERRTGVLISEPPYPQPLGLFSHQERARTFHPEMGGREGTVGRELAQGNTRARAGSGRAGA